MDSTSYLFTQNLPNSQYPKWAHIAYASFTYSGHRQSFPRRGFYEYVYMLTCSKGKKREVMPENLLCVVQQARQEQLEA